MMISAQIRTGQRVVVVRHCVTVEFLTCFSLCEMSGRPYQLGVGSQYRRKFLCVFCKNVYPLFEGFVCVCAPFCEWWSTHMSVSQVKCACNQLTNSCVQLCVSTLVNVQD